MQQYSAVIDGGEGGETTLEAENLREALDLAAEWAREGDYNLDSGDGTIWVSVSVTALDENGKELDGWHDNDSRTVAIDPDEPDCIEDGEHEWRSPHGIVGGIESNPGVYASGGGVICTECCVRCGCARITDTWAQDPTTGEQGLTSVQYEPGRWADEVPTPTEWELDAEIECPELRACAAYVLSALRRELPAAIRDAIPESSRERAYQVAEYAERVQRALRTRRALRLALHLAARNGSELRAATVIMDALDPRR